MTFGGMRLDGQLFGTAARLVVCDWVIRSMAQVSHECEQVFLVNASKAEKRVAKFVKGAWSGGVVINGYRCGVLKVASIPAAPSWGPMTQPSVLDVADQGRPLGTLLQWLSTISARPVDLGGGGPVCTGQTWPCYVSNAWHDIDQTEVMSSGPRIWLLGGYGVFGS